MTFQGVNLTYDILIERILQWAEGRVDIRLVVVIGSRARRDKPADVWSDLDLVLFTTDPAVYLSDSSWLTELGVFHLTFLEPTAVGAFVERRVLFDGGLDVDFIPLPTYVVQGDVPSEMSGVLQRGYRVLIDKDGLSRKLQSASEGSKDSGNPTSQQPSEASFLHVVNDFLYHAVWSAKKLCRRELWTAKMCCDGFMKRQLLQMMEWHHQASAGADDIWHEGRFLDSWADPFVLRKLRTSFASYEVDSVWTALETSVDVFGILGREFAEQVGYEYPTDAHQYVVGLLQTYRATNTSPSVAYHNASYEPERTGLLHHVEVNVSNLERSAKFWGWLLSYMGYESYQNWTEGQSWRKGDTYLVLVQTAQDRLDTGYHRKCTGLNHLAFHAESREQVDVMAQMLRTRDIAILYENRHPFAGGQEHYAVFFEDPDRIKVEIVAPD